jgi:hypothetical protein
MEFPSLLSLITFYKTKIKPEHLGFKLDIFWAEKLLRFDQNSYEKTDQFNTLKGRTKYWVGLKVILYGLDPNSNSSK